MVAAFMRALPSRSGNAAMLAAFVSLILAGCGGGGGEPPEPAENGLGGEPAVSGDGGATPEDSATGGGAEDPSAFDGGAETDSYTYGPATTEADPEPGGEPYDSDPGGGTFGTSGAAEGNGLSTGGEGGDDGRSTGGIIGDRPSTGSSTGGVGEGTPEAARPSPAEGVAGEPSGPAGPVGSPTGPDRNPGSAAPSGMTGEGAAGFDQPAADQPGGPSFSPLANVGGGEAAPTAQASRPAEGETSGSQLFPTPRGDQQQPRPAPPASPARGQGSAANAAGPADPGTARTHTVQAGDTFASIAREVYGEPRHWVVIAQANPLVDPTRLSVDQELRVPSLEQFQRQREQQLDRLRESVDGPGGSGRRESGERTVTVRPGDTLSQLAERVYGDASYWRLIFEANTDKLYSADDLYVGMELTIPPRPGSRSGGGAGDGSGGANR